MQETSGKNKGGRPRVWKPSIIELERVKELAKKGFSEKNIALQLGRSYKSFQTSKLKYPQIDLAIAEGELLGKQIITEILWEHIEDKQSRSHFQALKYYGDNIMGLGGISRGFEQVKGRIESGIGAPPTYMGVDYKVVKKEPPPEVAEDKKDGPEEL